MLRKWGYGTRFTERSTIPSVTSLEPTEGSGFSGSGSGEIDITTTAAQTRTGYGTRFSERSTIPSLTSPEPTEGNGFSGSGAGEIDITSTAPKNTTGTSVLLNSHGSSTMTSSNSTIFTQGTNVWARETKGHEIVKETTSSPFTDAHVTTMSSSASGAAQTMSTTQSTVTSTVPSSSATSASTPTTMHTAARAVDLYTYGLRADDVEFVLRDKNFNSRLFKPEIGFPFGRQLYHSLYVSVTYLYASCMASVCYEGWEY
ncbi:hypothetical protein NDU88_000406 [Pleurodeles waltl]|uniref:Uncharacterized protein n=1 Tax=Pleurodeles waltl TaxID=8319 RepID=A0AAV7L6H4_PLEWA|nr:hypothetical protein NDU88_000406 [Pleurodeles waltl]